MLEALSGLFETGILVVIYGQQPIKGEADINAADTKPHLRMAIIMGLISLIGYILLVQIGINFQKSTGRKSLWCCLVIRIYIKSGRSYILNT